MQKKGQITIFIILGILMLSGTILYFTFNKSEKSTKDRNINEVALIGFDQPSLKRYVEDCIEKTSASQIYILSQNAGKINLTDKDFKWYNGEKYRVIGQVIEGYKGYSLDIISRQMLEKELSSSLIPLIEACVILDPFEEKGYIIEKENISVKANIGYEDVIIEVYYPIRLLKGNSEIIISDFSKRLNYPLGELFEFAIDISNIEITEGDFDKDKFMQKTGEYISIEKYRPYPNKAYKLRKYMKEHDSYLEFRFMLKGEETISKIGTAKPIEYIFGCCENPYDEMCYKNADPIGCKFYGLKLIDNPLCICDIRVMPEEDELCDGKTCKDCTKTFEFKTGKYTGPSKKHGESWCSYDSVVLSLSGVGGMSYVGSRHRKHSCIDGKEIVEECRDYREELCTEQVTGGFSQATCRINRWDDCFLCEDEACCTDNSMRDCHWSEWLDTKNKCHPIVPPGFRFWNSEGSEVCNIATEFEKCGGFMCSNKWVDDTAINCYFQGDCGNYRNIADIKTKGGHLNTDPVFWPRSYVYHQDKLNINPSEYKKKVLELDLYTTDQYKGSLKYPTTASKMPILISAGLEYLDELSSLSIIDFMNPFEPPKISVLDYSFCSNWNPPTGGEYCHLCKEPFKECTEYRCKSLGQLCVYFEEEGEGKCIKEAITDNNPPVIIYDIMSLKENYSASYSELKLKDMTVRGVKISPELKQHRQFNFGIITSKKTRCKISYIPKINFEYLPSVWFGDASFSEYHNLTMRVPPALLMPQRIYQLLNITDLKELLDSLEDITGTYEIYKKRYATPIATYKLITGENPLEIIDPFIKIVLYLFQEYSSLYQNGKVFLKYLFEGFESNTYYMFIKCIDMQGKENAEDFFIEFTIDSNLNDKDPPEILGVEPKNRTQIDYNISSFLFNVYTDEWAECRYGYFDTDFDNMPGVMECPDSQYRINAAFDGSYECTAHLNATPIVYVRCKDNPVNKKSFYIGFNRSSVFNVTKEQSRYLNLTEPNKVIASGRYIDGAKMSVISQTIDLNFYLDNPYLCKYGANDTSFDEMKNILSCEPTEPDKVDIGVYVCKESVRTDSDMYISCIDTNETVRNVNDKSYEVIYNFE